MKRIREKLKSGRGASMVFALLVFLLCVLAGTVALTAASSNIGRYTHLEDEQRQYFSVASALELIQGQLDEYKPVEVTVQYVETDVWEYVGGTINHYPTYAFTITPDASALTYFQAMLLREDGYVPAEWKSSPAWTTLLNGPLAVATWTDKEYTVALDGSVTEDWADSVYPVTVEVTKNPLGDAKFNLVMYLSTEGGAYPLKVEWPGEVKTETKTETETTKDPGRDAGMRTTTTTITITLTWSKEDRQITFEKAS